MGGMTERDDKRSGSGCAIGLVVILVVLPVLYVLSIGPAYGVARRFPATDDFLRSCYLPLGFLHEKIPAFARLLDWYMGLFV